MVFAGLHRGIACFVLSNADVHAAAILTGIPAACYEHAIFGARYEIQNLFMFVERHPRLAKFPLHFFLPRASASCLDISAGITSSRSLQGQADGNTVFFYCDVFHVWAITHHHSQLQWYPLLRVRGAGVSALGDRADEG